MLVPAVHSGDRRVFIYSRTNLSAPVAVLDQHTEAVTDLQWRRYRGGGCVQGRWVCPCGGCVGGRYVQGRWVYPKEVGMSNGGGCVQSISTLYVHII